MRCPRRRLRSLSRSPSPFSLFFYISGHGFGHAARQIEIVNAVSALLPSASIVIRTTAARWLFDRTARGPWAIVEGEVDPGVTQLDSLRLDEAETIRRATSFYNELDRRAEDEAALLRRHGAAFVISDVPPLACAAAFRAGIPSVVCANFTWDWIYAAYGECLQWAPDLLPAIRDAYALASAGWRLPMHGGFDTVAAIVDVPFVARQPRPDRTRDDIRRALDLPLGTPLALVSFGGYGVEGLPPAHLDCATSWGVVVTRGTGATGVIALEETAIYAAGLRYQDLVRAVDVVVTKPGYGIITDCVASGTAMLYTSRGSFAEYDVLVAEMPRYLRCRFIESDDLRAGRWRDALDALMASPPPPETPRLDGARVVAEMIAEYL